jgi:hypothetical protein
VPEDQAVKAELLQRYYNDLLAGYYGLDKTVELLERKYYWAELKPDIKKYIEEYAICQ